MNYKKMTKAALIVVCEKHEYNIKILQNDLRGERRALKRANADNEKLRTKISRFFSEVLGG